MEVIAVLCNLLQEMWLEWGRPFLVHEVCLRGLSTKDHACSPSEVRMQHNRDHLTQGITLSVKLFCNPAYCTRGIWYIWAKVSDDFKVETLFLLFAGLCQDRSARIQLNYIYIYIYICIYIYIYIIELNPDTSVLA